MLTDQEAAGTRVAYDIREQPHGASQARVAFARSAAGARSVARRQHPARVKHAGHAEQQQMVQRARQKHLRVCVCACI